MTDIEYFKYLEEDKSQQKLYYKLIKLKLKKLKIKNG